MASTEAENYKKVALTNKKNMEKQQSCMDSIDSLISDLNSSISNLESSEETWLSGGYVNNGVAIDQGQINTCCAELQSIIEELTRIKGLVKIDRDNYKKHYNYFWNKYKSLK